MKNWAQAVFIALLIIISIRFYDAKFIDDSLINRIGIIIIFVAVIASLPYIFPKSRGFVFPVQLIILSILISVPIANIYRYQSYWNNIISTYPYLLWFAFFYLLHIKVSLETLEKIIVGFGVLYIILYGYQLLNSSTIIFGKSLYGDEFTIDRGMTRIIFPGGGLFILTSFIAFTKLTIQSRYRWFWALLTICGILIPVLQVTRQFIAGMLLLLLYSLISNLNGLKKVVAIFLMVSAFTVSLIYLIDSNLPIIQGLAKATEQDTGLGQKYIRVLAGKYFIDEFSTEFVTKIFGNGVPNWGQSDYGILIELLSVQKEYFLSDVGIIAVYVMFGIMAVLGYILIWVKSFTIPLPKKYHYLKYYLWFLLLTSLTWYTVYYYHYLITTVLVIYMYQRVYECQQARVVGNRNDLRHATKQLN